MLLAQLRKDYHRRIGQEVIRISSGKEKNDIEYPNFADSSNLASVRIAWGIVSQIVDNPVYGRLAEQTTGRAFERITHQFIERAFTFLKHLRPGQWIYTTEKTAISNFDQYEHLDHITRIFDEHPELASALGGDYIIKPDIIIARLPVSDEEINKEQMIVSNDPIAAYSPLRERNQTPPHPILHASISCKWTIRSDRSQNTRTEALNLVRNRKGRTPHIIAVTAEPIPTRIAALALGTGDLDCVYHFALNELKNAVSEIKNEDQLDMLDTLVQGRRLRDISDLPLDLAI